MISLDCWVEPTKQIEIREAIAQVGAISLSLIREALGETYTYDEIKLVRALWHREQTEHF
jgi:ATP-dependent DNA helicase RecQ